MIGNKRMKFDTLDSTNTYIKSNYKNLESGTIVQALHQSNGYGRMNRVWHDDKKSNLMFSIYLKLAVSEDITLLTQMAASSIHKTLETYKIQAKIKWPNDVLVNEKKICGILLESIIEKDVAHIIIGIGLNVNNQSHHGEIKNIATSMFQQTKQEYDLDTVLNTLLDILNNDFNDYLNKTHSYINVCRKNSFLIGKEVILSDTLEKAVVEDIDHKGRLIININNKTKQYVGSEIILPDLYSTKE